MAVIHEPVRSALMRSASVKSILTVWAFKRRKCRNRENDKHVRLLGHLGLEHASRRRALPPPRLPPLWLSRARYGRNSLSLYIKY